MAGPPKGSGAIGTIPLNYGTNITLLGALGIEGLQAVMTVEGASDADVFRTYVQQVLGPTLAPGDIVVLDNLPVHKTPGIQQALARRRARRLYVPPYSPDLSPMELCLSQVKTALRAAKARTREALETESSRPWRSSPPSTPSTGSGIVAMPYSHMKTALIADFFP